jgi:ABC-2 type transport system ATP-binding protein
MHVLLGFVPATSGHASLFGVDVRQPIARQRIGYLPELTYYYKFLTAEELLRFYARIFGIPPAQRLDPIGRMQVRAIIQRLKNEGKTVFFSSHELGEVETVCDRVGILAGGELKVQGRVDELVRRHQCNLEQLFLRVIGYTHATLPILSAAAA